MKRILTTIQQKACKILMIAILAGAMASCDSVMGFDEGDCSIEYRIKFKYDMNMEEVDAFAKQVRTVTLYAFDDNNTLVYQKTEEGEQLGEANYTMQVDINPENYHLIVWAGLNDQSFAVPLLTPTLSQIEELKVKTLRQYKTVARGTEEEKDQYVVEQNLHSLWHGEVRKGTFTQTNGKKQILTVGLTKNTNNIRVVVAQVNRSGNPIPSSRALNKNTFECALYDDNGYMNYDNSILDDNLLTYKPFVVEENTVSSRAFSSANEPAQNYDAVVSELSTARLMADKAPQLTIKNTETGEVLFNCSNLVKYLEMLQLDKYKGKYGLQEYLDREDNYSVIIFVDEKMALIRTVIEINAWVIQLNDIEL